MSSYTANLGLYMMDDGTTGWGPSNNINIGTLLEQAVSGYVTQAITDGVDTTITIPNGSSGVARNMIIECTGALTANRNLIVPANRKLYFIYNNTTGGFAVTVKVSGQTGVSVPNGKKMSLVSNGTDIVENITYFASFSVSAINNIPIGNITPSTGAFTTLTASSTVTFSPASANVVISPSGTGTVTISPVGALTINPTAASTINNTSIGVTTAAAGRFTTLTATAAVTLSPASANITISPTGTGTVTINPAAASTMDNVAIGGTVSAAGAFTTLSATSTVSGAGFTARFATPGPIGNTVASTGAFTTLTASGNVTLSPTGSVTINPSVASAFNNASIGATTRSTGAFTTLTANSTATLTAGLTVSGAAFASRGIADNATTTVLTLATSGVALTLNGNVGTHSTKIDDSAGTSFNAGFLEVPINTQNTAYVPVLSDSGKAIYHSDGSARTYTIPANSSVAYPVGTTLTFINDASAGVNVTIAITTDTLVFTNDGTTGSRLLARYGRATAQKVTSTRWLISGVGLS